MGESRGADLQVAFDGRIRVQFQGAKVTSEELFQSRVFLAK